jgi:hypothetical protein
MLNYFVEFNPFFGSPDHVPRYIATNLKKADVLHKRAQGTAQLVETPFLSGATHYMT